MSRKDFLVEIGTEELPPKSLLTLLENFANGIVKALDAANLVHGPAQTFATPRRLAVLIQAVADRQPDVEIKRQGPAIANAFDADGVPTKAALGFAASCGVAIDQLEQVDGPKARVLQYVGTRPGRSSPSICCRRWCQNHSMNCRSQSACDGALASSSSSDRCIGL